jgi:hypothetical protein
LLKLDFLQLPNTVRLPNFKKLRQWSQDSIINISQLTGRSNDNLVLKQRAKTDKNLSKTGISTISSAIETQKIDPKKDNFGLYALKCDRSRNLANAKRGIILNIPTTKVKAKNEANSYQSIERNHEIFESCEGYEENLIRDYKKKNNRSSQEKKVEAPPRKNKRRKNPFPNNVQQAAKHKQHLKQAIHSVLTMDSLEKNDSGHYCISEPTEVAKLTYVESKKSEKNLNIVKPKVEKAVVVQTSTQTSKQTSKTKTKHQRRSSNTFVKNINLFELKETENSIDIFKSNRLMDHKKIFDEFDELFEKSKQYDKVEKARQPSENALKKLNELEYASVSNSPMNNLNEELNSNANFLQYQNFYKLTSEVSLKVKEEKELLKPNIISETIKEQSKKKILYYDDEKELRELIKNQTSVNSSKMKMLTRECDVKKIGNLNQHSMMNTDCKNPNPHTSAALTKSNSLRIFSNEGIFVFNL